MFVLVLVLENAAYLGSGSLFGAEVPQIEHEHDDEHDSLAAQWLKLLLWIAHYSKEEDRSALLVCDCG